MAYFVCLMLAPAFQLRRLRQAMVSDGGAEGADGAPSAARERTISIRSVREDTSNLR